MNVIWVEKLNRDQVFKAKKNTFVKVIRPNKDMVMKLIVEKPGHQIN